MSRKILEEIALSGPESLFETQHAHPRVWKVLRNHISSRGSASALTPARWALNAYK